MLYLHQRRVENPCNHSVKPFRYSATLRIGEEVSRLAHIQENAGSIPASATKKLLKMIRKNTKEPTINHYCGECALAVADYKFENLSLEGKPTLVSCPYSGKYKKVVSEVACNKFQPKS